MFGIRNDVETWEIQSVPRKAREQVSILQATGSFIDLKTKIEIHH